MYQFLLLEGFEAAALIKPDQAGCVLALKKHSSATDQALSVQDDGIDTFVKDEINRQRIVCDLIVFPDLADQKCLDVFSMLTKPIKGTSLCSRNVFLERNFLECQREVRK